MVATVRPRKRIFYGWWIVASAFGFAFYQSGAFFYGFGAFFNPIQQEFQWSYGLMSVVFALRGMESGVVAPIIGMSVDRLGSRKLMLAGTIVFGAGLFALAAINSILTFYAAYLLIALGQSMVFGMVPMAAVINWFQRRRGLALGIFLSGGGLGGFMVPAITVLIEQVGWRGTLAVLGAGALVLGIPMAMVVRDRPEDYGYLPDGDEPGAAPTGAAAAARAGGSRASPAEGLTLREALHTRAFWLLTAAMILSGAASQAVSVHHIPYLRSVGFSPALAALSVTTMAVISVPGRPILGYAADRTDVRLITAVIMSGLGVGVFVFAFVAEFWQLIPFFFTFGVGFGGMIALRPLIQSQYFGRRAFGSIQGVMQTLTTVGGIVSPVLTGVVFDLTGSYRPALLALAVISLLSVPLVLLTRRPRRVSKS
ncbi:MAG: MFS transporter [Chloroflexi bacterium]|nr:MFS transporter [Chloroflexota bacterium]